jgi:hypothetical protein
MVAHPKLSVTHAFRPLDEPMITYFVGDEQCKVLEAMNIQLPSDYYFIELVEEHAQQICDEQIKSGQSNLEFTAWVFEILAKCNYNVKKILKLHFSDPKTTINIYI